MLLLAVSLGLYALWSGAFLALLLAIIGLSYYSAFELQPGHKRRKILLTLCIVFNLSVLAYFKYAGFFADNFRALLDRFGTPVDAVTAQLILPLGISFLIFQALSYLFEVYHGRLEPTRDFVSHALLIAFFPKIASGPIERPEELLPQFKQRHRLTKDLLFEGMFLILWGAIEKFCIADNAALISEKLFSPLPSVSLLTGALALTLQIFADFSGYSNMAKGLAALLGFQLSWNFNIPYLSRSPSEFWRRWHITLSQWFQKYVYIPLGGSRRGLTRTAINLLLTMTLVGLWHGARWMFILWGLYQGILLVLYRYGEKILPEQSKLIQLLHKTGLSWLFFFGLTMFGWILFQSATVGSMVHLFQWASVNPVEPMMIAVILLWLPIIFMQTLQHYRKDLLAIAHLSLPWQLAFYFIAYYMIMYLPPLNPQQFIYVQF